MTTFLRTIIAVCALAATGCGHAPRSASDPDPTGKIPAIQLAVSQNDRRVLPQLVADLESGDSAIRFYAIEALRKMTGRDLDYQYFVDEDLRGPAVERWKQWLATQPK